MSTKPSSLEGAFRDRVDGSAVLGAPNDPEQLDLLRDAKGKLPSNVFQLARKAQAGRPPGARNKRNDVLAKLVCQQSGDPVLFMASIYAMPLDQLVELLKIASPSEGKAPPGDLALRALTVQLQAARDVSSYVHSRKPVEVQHHTNVDFRAIVVGGRGDVPPMVQQNLVDAINSGLIEEQQLKQIRIIDGDYTVIDDGEDAA